MIEIISFPRRSSTIFAPAPFDLACAFERGQRAVERLVGEPQFGGEILERAVQIDAAAVGAGIDAEKMADALARRADIALLDARAQVHHLAGERRAEGLRGFRVLVEGGQQRRFRIDAHHRVGAGDGVAVIGRRKQRRLGDGLARAGDIENDFAAGAVDARQPHAAGDDFAEAGGLVAEPEQRLAGFQFAVDRRGAHRGGKPILARHGLPHHNSLTARLSPIQLSNSQASSPVFFAAPGTP